MMFSAHHRDDGFPNPPKGNPSFWQRNPSRVKQIPNPAQRNPNKILGFPSPNPALSRSYADPQGLFSFWAASGLKGATAAPALLARLALSVVRSVFISGSSDLLEQVKGWRHLDRGFSSL
jgi:hypothetical protein